MGVRQTSRYCRYCEKKTLHARRVFSTGWGVFLTLITAGLFIPVWMLLGVAGAFQTWKCQACGKGRLT